MPGCPIIRFNKHKTSAAITGRAGHHLRTIPVENADPSRSHLNSILMGLDSPKAIRKQVMEMTAPLVKRKDNVRCIEVFLGASDDFWDSGGDWKALAEAHKAMLISEFGEKNIIGLGWHLDERRPHGWAFIAPITPENKLSAAHWIDGPTKIKKFLTRVQPHFNPLGMERAREGVRATHIEMHDLHAANAGNKRAKRQVEIELQQRISNAGDLVKKAEDELGKVREDLANAAIRKVYAEKQVEIELEKGRLWLKKAEDHVQKEHEKITKQTKFNDDFRKFLNSSTAQLRQVFSEMPEAVLGLLPSKLRTNLLRFFDQMPIQPQKPIEAPKSFEVPLPSVKPSVALVEPLEDPQPLSKKKLPKP